MVFYGNDGHVPACHCEEMIKWLGKLCGGISAEVEVLVRDPGRQQSEICFIVKSYDGGQEDFG